MTDIHKAGSVAIQIHSSAKNARDAAADMRMPPANFTEVAIYEVQQRVTLEDVRSALNQPDVFKEQGKSVWLVLGKR